MSLPQDTKPPLLREIFERKRNSTSPPNMSLGSLAKALNVLITDLIPFVASGHIHLSPPPPAQSISSLSSHSQIVAIPESAINWMRSWLLPVYAKGLFSIDNMADLLNIPQREVLPLAAAHEVPVMRDGSVGFVFSIWSARTLLLRSIRGRDHTARMDRQALLWSILNEDPEKAAAPPPFDKRIEQELERVAKLEEPTRSLRSAEILSAMHDAWLVAESIRASRGGKTSETTPTCEETPISPSPDISEPQLP